MLDLLGHGAAPKPQRQVEGVAAEHVVLKLRKRRLYEIARRGGVRVLVQELVRGGRRLGDAARLLV